MAAPASPPPAKPARSQTEVLREKLQRSAKKLKEKNAANLMNTPRTQARTDGIWEANVRHAIELQAKVAEGLCERGAFGDARAGLKSLMDEMPVVLGFANFWCTFLLVEKHDVARTALIYKLALENVQGRERLTLFESIATHFAEQAGDLHTLADLLEPTTGTSGSGPSALGSTFSRLTVASAAPERSPRPSPVKQPVSLLSVLAQEPSAAASQAPFAVKHAFKSVVRQAERLATPPVMRLETPPPTPPAPTQSFMALKAEATEHEEDAASQVSQHSCFMQPYRPDFSAPLESDENCMGARPSAPVVETPQSDDNEQHEHENLIGDVAGPAPGQENSASDNATAAAFKSPAKPTQQQISGRFASLFASPPGRVVAQRTPPRSAQKRLLDKSPSAAATALGSVIAIEAVRKSGGAKQATPVRRSTRTSEVKVPFKAQVDFALAQSDFNYAPNPALPLVAFGDIEQGLMPAAELPRRSTRHTPKRA